MPRPLSWLPTLLLLAGFAGPASGTRVVVPTDSPTIQAALDTGADTVAVMDGVVPERLTIARCVVLEPVVGHVPYLHTWSSRPLIQSIEVFTPDESACAVGVFVRGFRILGEATAETIWENSHITFEACRFDSGFTGPNAGIQASFAVLSVRGCLFLGDAALSGYVQFLGNTVIGGKIRIRADGVHDIRDNYVQGPADAGLELNLSESSGTPVSRNTVRGTGDGILLVGDDGATTVAHNDVADCSGNGIVYRFSDHGAASCDSNTVARCGGVGILVRSEQSGAFPGASLNGNRVSESGLGGIEVANGILVSGRGNEVLDSGGDGITTGLADNFEGNVIGRSGGAGLRVTLDPVGIEGNTIFSSAGPGLYVSASSSTSNLIRNNIAAFNGGPGLLFQGSQQPQLACNDWFANAGGATVGIPAGATDLALHPMFCDLGGGDVRLAADSPLLNAEACGLIGALGLGCGSTTGVPESRDGAATGFSAWPVPAGGAVRFVVPEMPGPLELEVFDVTGARRWHAPVPAGSGRLQWDRRESGGRAAAPGVYFARLSRGGVEVARVRIVLTE